MEFPIKLHRRCSYTLSGVSQSYLMVTEIKDERVIGFHHEALTKAERPFNVKLHKTTDGKGKFTTGSDSGKSWWYFADAGKVPVVER